MRLVIRVLGAEVFALEAGTEDATEDEGSELAGGTTYATPMGFVARMDPPQDVDFPDRVVWD